MREGEIVRDRYSLVRALGEGGSATTWLATDRVSGEPVVLKQFDLAAAREWKSAELFEREARVLAQLNHPGIPRYRDSFAEGPRAFLVQSLAAGRPLSEIGRVDETRARLIARDVLAILSYLHGLVPKVVHRDVKPANLVVDDDGRVRLVDFGGVRLHRTDGSTMIGTAGYAAPEQYTGSATPASDLYGLGATLVFLLFGVSPAELPQKRLRVQLPREPRLSADFARWLTRLLEPAPEDRFPSAREALLALDAKPSSPRTFVLAGVLVALLAVGGGTAFYASRRPSVTVDKPGARSVSPFGPRLETFRLPEVRELRRVPAHVSAVFGVAASADGKVVATASWDGTVKLWNTDTWSSTATLGHDGNVGDVRFLDGGKTLASGGGSWIKLWDVASGKLIRAVNAGTTQVTRLDLDPSGKVLLSAGFDGQAHAWSLPDMQPKFTLAHSPNAGRSFDARFSPDGHWVATTGDDKTLKVWTADGKLVSTLTGHQRATTNAAFSADGTLLASSSDDGTARVFHLPDCSPLTTLRAASDETWAISFSPDGRFVLLGSKDGRLRVFSRPSFSQRFNVADGERGTTSIAFLDDTRFVTSHVSGSIKLWALPPIKSRPVPEAKLVEPPIVDASPATALARKAERLIDTADGRRAALDGAEELANNALSLQPKHALALVQLARVAYKRGYVSGNEYGTKGLERAHTFVDQAIASDPKLFEAHETRAWAFLFANDLPRARKATEDAAAIDAERSGVRLLKAELAIREKTWDEAERQLLLLLEHGATLAHVERAYSSLLDVYRGLGEYVTMDAIHQRLVALRPKSAWTRGNYALFLVQRGENGRAIEVAHEAIAIGDYPVVHRYLAAAHVQAGIESLWDLDRADGAKAHFEAALDEWEGSADAHYGLAAVYRANAVRARDKKQLKLAKAELEKTLGLDKDHWWAQKALAEMPGLEASL